MMATQIPPYYQRQINAKQRGVYLPPTLPRMLVACFCLKLQTLITGE